MPKTPTSNGSIAAAHGAEKARRARQGGPGRNPAAEELLIVDEEHQRHGQPAKAFHREHAIALALELEQAREAPEAPGLHGRPPLGASGIQEAGVRP
jgi:hypothetical protein